VNEEEVGVMDVMFVIGKTLEGADEIAGFTLNGEELSHFDDIWFSEGLPNEVKEDPYCVTLILWKAIEVGLKELCENGWEGE